MERTNQYACGGNLGWLKPCFSTSPGVPFNENSIQKLQNYYFKEDTAPQRFPGLVIVAVSNSQAPNGMMGERGAMEQVSPPELLHAFIMRVAELVRQGAPHDVLSGWLRVFLTCMMVFEKLPTVDAKSARSDSLRENAVAEYHGIAWTVLQKVYHIGYYRDRKIKELGSLSAARVAQLYNEERVSAKGSLCFRLSRIDPQLSNQKPEAMTESYVDQALTIWNRMLTCPELTSLLLKMDKAYGHDAPLNGVVQYQLLISKTRTQARSC